MTHHILETPVTEAQVRALKIGDTVTLEKTLFGVRDANLIAMFDKGRKTIFDMKGHAVVHTAPNVRKVPVTNECPSGYEAMCVGTTTSQRMERFTRPLMEREGVRIIIGKGGMGQGTLDAFRDIGGAYLAVIGGAAALQTTWIESIEEVDMDDLNPGKHLALPHQGLRPAAGDHGFARRLDLRARPGRRQVEARRDPGEHRRLGVARSKRPRAANHSGLSTETIRFITIFPAFIVKTPWLIRLFSEALSQCVSCELHPQGVRYAATCSIGINVCGGLRRLAMARNGQFGPRLA